MVEASNPQSGVDVAAKTTKFHKEPCPDCTGPMRLTVTTLTSDLRRVSHHLFECDNCNKRRIVAVTDGGNLRHNIMRK